MALKQLKNKCFGSGDVASFCPVCPCVQSPEVGVGVGGVFHSYNATPSLILCPFLASLATPQNEGGERRCAWLYTHCLRLHIACVPSSTGAAQSRGHSKPGPCIPDLQGQHLLGERNLASSFPCRKASDELLWGKTLQCAYQRIITTNRNIPVTQTVYKRCFEWYWETLYSECMYVRGKNQALSLHLL